MHYWRNVLSRAWRDTRDLGPFANKVRLFAAVFAVVVVTTLQWVQTDGQFAPTAFVGFCATLVFLAFVLLYRLIAAPAVLAREQAAKLASLQATLEDRESRQNGFRRLVELIDTGTAVKGAKISSEHDLEDWFERYNRWGKDAHAAVRELFGVAEAKLWANIEVMPAVTVTGSFNELHSHNRVRLGIYLERLRAEAERLRK